MSKEFDLYVGYYEFICYGICWAYRLFPGKRVFGMCYEDQGDGLLENRIEILIAFIFSLSF